MRPIETFEHNGKTIEIHVDDDAEQANPRHNDNLGTMVCFHRRYRLGDDHPHVNPECFKDFLRRYKPPIVINLFLYDHSGITMRASEHGGNPFNCPWDSGCVGVIYVTREKLLDEYPPKPSRSKAGVVFETMTGKPRRRRLTKAVIEQARKVLLSEVEEYDAYIRGDVYGYVIKDEHGEDIESCWGFIGRDYVEQAAKEAAA